MAAVPPPPPPGWVPGMPFPPGFLPAGMPPGWVPAPHTPTPYIPNLAHHSNQTVPTQANIPVSGIYMGSEGEPSVNSPLGPPTGEQPEVQSYHYQTPQNTPPRQPTGPPPAPMADRRRR